MASPFNIFRRNQRVMMVVLTGLSMFAFLFFDMSSMKSGGMNKPLVVMMTAGLCAAGMWFVGQRHGKSQEWALWAALAGGVAAFLFVRSSDPLPAVNTSAGSFTDAQLQRLGQKRMQVNQFLMRAAQLSKSQRGTQGFGPFDERSMLQFALSHKEAKRLGISLNDEAVNRFIGEVTEKKLSAGDFHKILGELSLSEGDLFNTIRGELEARMALEIQTPLYDTWKDMNFQTRQTSIRPKMPATPQEDWELFRKLNVKQSLSVVALPVDEFLKKVPDPSEAELQAFFESRSKQRPGVEGEPGFLQPPRAKLAYIAAEFAKFESQAAAPTDAEIEAFYEQNKFRYQIREIPGLDDDKPADAGFPENVLIDSSAIDAKPDQPASDAKPEDKPESDKAADKTDGEKKDDEKKEEADKKSGDSSSLTKPATIRLVSAVTQNEESKEKTAEKTDEKSPVAADEVKDSGDKTSEKPESKSTEEETGIDAAPATDEEGEKMPALPAPSKNPKPEIRYKPLNDELKSEIRETMLRDRAFDKMGEAVDLALEEMRKAAFVYLGAEDKDKVREARKIAEQLKEYAEKQGLQYVETPFLSATEMQTSSSETIGMAVPPSSGSLRERALTVIEDVFPDNGQQGPLYFPQRADSRVISKRYAWWKIEDKPQHEPKWTDEGIAEQVKTAWKYQQARGLAGQRAKQLLDLAQAEPDNFSAALAGQTVTGEPGTESIVIKETPRFSWLSTAMSTPADMQSGHLPPPRLSFVSGVDRPNDDFMKLVFETLGDGEVGVGMNADRSAFYVVKVQDRDGVKPESDVEGYQTLVDLRAQFLSTHGNDQLWDFLGRPYHILMMNTFGQLQQEWTKAFDARYGVELDDPDFMPGSSQKRRR